ncbi:MAG: molybdenum cofactor guanylyltransferase MobA [Polaromonas sp.]|nr:MAG: molybdenum cofactor guanylyltransferase MobA [Polaromonas sp.]
MSNPVVYPPLQTQEITAVILAGGRGSRMGGVDKGLQNFKGVPLALHTLQRLSPQVGRVMINANRNRAAYEAFGVPVWLDAATLGDYAGPLAGFMTALAHCQTPYLLTVPCDTPLFPHDLASRLADALASSQADFAVASAPEEHGQLRAQPVFCLMGVHMQGSLQRFTQGGGRKIDAWTAQHKVVHVSFDRPGDDSCAFFNANTLAELHQLHQLASRLP